MEEKWWKRWRGRRQWEERRKHVFGKGIKEVEKDPEIYRQKQILGLQPLSYILLFISGLEINSQFLNSHKAKALRKPLSVLLGSVTIQTKTTISNLHLQINSEALTYLYGIKTKQVEHPEDSKAFTKIFETFYNHLFKLGMSIGIFIFRQSVPIRVLT